MKTKEEIALYWLKQNSMTLHERFWNAMEEYASQPSPVMSAEQVEDKSAVIIEQLKSDLKRVKLQRNEYELEVRNLYRRITQLSYEIKQSPSPSVKADGWVSVEDGMPAIPPKYWNAEHEAWQTPLSIRVNVFDGEDVYEYHFTGTFEEDITHWQPLPAPPNQDGE